jgi:aryl-alcohol dehydrogenase-like predicted oxidoreductase
MQTSTLGPTSISVPKICLGTMTWGNQNTEAQAHEQLSHATSQGFYFIDTAERYPIPPAPDTQGLTETFIGNWLEKRGKRDDLIIASKVACSTPMRTREATGKFDRKNIRDAIEGSLSRLKTDYLDLYQVHWPERETNFFGPRGYTHDPQDEATPIEETLQYLDELVKEGKVRHIGVSNETPWGVAEYLRVSREKGLARLATIQNQYSLLNRTFEVGLAEFSHREQVSLLPYSPLSMGVLTGKYLGGARPPGARFTLFERNAARYNADIAQPAIEAYVNIAKKYGLDPAAMAIAWAMQMPFVASVIIGATSMEQLKTDLSAMDITLSPECLAEIDAVYKQYPDPHA